MRAAGETYPGRVLDLSNIDLEEIANALADQTDYEHHWLINPFTGEIAFWTADIQLGGIYWLLGCMVWIGGVSISVLSAYRRGEERGDW